MNFMELNLDKFYEIKFRKKFMELNSEKCYEIKFRKIYEIEFKIM